MLAEIWGNKNSDPLLVGMYDGKASLKGSLTASYKAKIRLSYDSAILLLGIYAND